MDALLAKLERHFGKLAIEQLPLIIVGGMACAFGLGKIRPEFLDALELNLDAVRHGQVWRLVTYLFLPRTSSVWWIFFSLYITWMIGSALEEAWGAFKLNVYYLIGMIGTTIAAWLFHGSPGNTYLNYSLFFAFATIYPDYELTLFFTIPVKVKWLVLAPAGMMVLDAFGSDWAVRGAIIASVANYLLFFSGHLVGLLQGRRVLARQAARRESFRAPIPTSMPTSPKGDAVMGARVCAICGTREDEGADIRVCSCAQCGGVARPLCLAHAKEHAAAARQAANA